jgi:hypothetical protein
MRIEHTRGRLGQHVGANPAITTTRFEEAFTRALEHLHAFIAEHGHANPSSTYRAPDGYRLGDALTRCRYQYKYGTLSPERCAALSEIPGWVWQRRRRDPAPGRTVVNGCGSSVAT